MLIDKSKILNQIFVKMLKFSTVPEYKGKPIVETLEHFFCIENWIIVKLKH